MESGRREEGHCVGGGHDDGGILEPHQSKTSTGRTHRV